MSIAKKLAGIGAVLTGVTVSGAVFAQEALQNLETVGIPEPRGWSFQPAATEIARRSQSLDWLVHVISAIITVFVVALLLYIVVRYNNRANKTPATFTHNSVVEVVWTIVPIVVLIVIGAFSLPVLFYQMEIPKADVTIKVTGNQWYWSYEYSDNEFGFDSFMLEKDELAAAGYQPDEYLLATDTAVVVPVNKNVVLHITGSDVIHAWTIPAFGVKLDAVPGRLAQTWFNATREGVYFGQCSELCGKDHSYMPITVKVVSQEVYDAWLEGAIAEFAGTPTPVAVASN